MPPTRSPLEVAVRAAVAGDLRLIKGNLSLSLALARSLSRVQFDPLFLSSPLFIGVEMATTMDLRRGRGRNGRNMLHFSATSGVLDLCSFLVEEAGFDPNSVSAEGNPIPHALSPPPRRILGTQRSNNYLESCSVTSDE